MKSYIYVKYGDDTEPLKQLVNRVLDEYETEVIIYTDSRRNNFVYNQMKSELKFNQILAIQSLNTLGNDDLMVYAELKNLYEREIILLVNDIKSTQSSDFERNHLALATIIEMYELTNPVVTESFNRYKASLAGRKKISYPEGWEELYTRWSNKEITSTEFMNKTGLKKGTFYHILTEYKELMDVNNEVLEKA